jgi:copper chaperone NosL
MERECVNLGTDHPHKQTGGIMKRIRIYIWTLIVLLFFSIAFSADRKPVKPSPKDKCPVCGMFVSKYPDWAAQIIFKDGSYAVFDGVKDMFIYYFSLSKYNPTKKTSDIDSIYVTEYYGLTLMDGFRAFYVIGSDVYGPMGKELIPLAEEGEAKEFLDDHSGKSILTFKEITPDVIKSTD